MDLSLRDLADRCGVSAPMLSQVERGETSPTLAGRGPDRRRPRAALSQLLRLDEDGAVTVVRRAERREGPAQRRGPRLRDPDAAAARPARRALAPHARARARSPAARATRRCTSPAAARRRSSNRAQLRSSATDTATSCAAGDCVTFDADLPHHFENPGPDRGCAARRRQRRPAEELDRTMPQTLFDKIWDAHEVAPGPAVHRPAPRPRGHEPAGVRRPAARRAQGPPPRPHARDRRPQRPDRRHARSRRGSATSSPACRWRRSSATARSSGSRCTRSAPSTRGSCT